jgi:hypothetical protein
MKLILLFCGLLFATVAAFAQTTLTGKVTDAKTGEPVVYANVVLRQNNTIIMGVQTDFDGFYVIENILPQTYEVEISAVGMVTSVISKFPILLNQPNKFDAKMKELDLENQTVITICLPKIDLYNTEMKRTLSNNDIEHLPTKNITEMLQSGAGFWNP